MKMFVHPFVIVGVIGIATVKADGSFGLGDMIGKCFDQGDINEIIRCATGRTIKIMELAANQKNLEIFPGVGVSISPTSSGVKNIKNKTLAPNMKQQNESSIKHLVDATAKFMSGRIIQINVSKSSAEKISKAIEEGRGKMKKINPILLILGALVTLIVPLMIGGVSLISGKALVIGKIAAVLSLIAILNNLLMGGTNILPYYGQGQVPSKNYGVPTYPTYPNNYPYGTNTLGGWNTQDKYPYARSFSRSIIMKQEPEKDKMSGK
ncbi:DUF1676 domain-containing protein Osi14 [Leptinotarsa decemlineata]|uniref:DUF1676 domain-containing protein Osi14 n=1 Tax=Leptinotarsa decemlineata TaxID=7539 RepID=UPI003D305A1B